MFEILPMHWSLRPTFTQKWASVDTNWGGGFNPQLPRQFQPYLHSTTQQWSTDHSTRGAQAPISWITERTSLLWQFYTSDPDGATGSLSARTSPGNRSSWWETPMERPCSTLLSHYALDDNNIFVCHQSLAINTATSTIVLLLATPKQYCINRPSLSLQTKHTIDS